jgi:hypothetical protein
MLRDREPALLVVFLEISRIVKEVGQKYREKVQQKNETRCTIGHEGNEGNDRKK